MSEGNAKRRWFQFHLSTCVAMILVGGELAWLNQIPRYEIQIEKVTYIRPDFIYRPSEKRELKRSVIFGWPYGFYLVEGLNKEIWIKNVSFMELRALQEAPWDDLDSQKFEERLFFPGGVLRNLLVGITILMALGFLLEYIIRRERKQQDPQP